MNAQQKVMHQLDTQHGRTVGGIAKQARLTYDETLAALMALRDKQIAFEYLLLWYLVDEVEAA